MTLSSPRFDYPDDHPDREPIAAELAGFTIEHVVNGKPVNVLSTHSLLAGLIGAVHGGNDEWRRENGVGTADQVTADHAIGGLELLDDERAWLDVVERVLIEVARDRGETWESLGARLGRSPQAQQQRYRRIDGQRTWPTRRPASDPVTPPIA